MVNEQVAHDVTGKLQKVFPLRPICIGGGWQGLYFDQLQVQLIHQDRRVPGVLTILGIHFDGRQAPEFGIENGEKLVRRLAISASEAGHQTSDVPAVW